MKLETKLFLIFHKQYATTNSACLLPYSSIPGPRKLPLIGNLWRYLPLIGDYKLDTLFENAQFNQKHYGSIVREDLMKSHSILHLFDPKDVEKFVRQDGKYPFRRSHRALLKYRLDRPELYLDGGLFCENGPSWYRQRNQFQQRLLSVQQVAANIGKLDETSFALMDQVDGCLQKAGNLIGNFQNLIFKWALGNSLRLFLDLDVNKLEDGLVRTLIQELHNSLIAIDGTEIKSNKWTKQPSKCPYYGLLEQSQEVLYKFVSEHVERRTAKTASNVSYLSDWLFEDKLKQSDVISFIIDALMAGLHTTSYTVANLLYYIAQDKAIQSSLQMEIQESFSKREPITMDSIERLRLLRSCLKETMRLKPVSIGTGRLTTDKLVLRNYEIPKNIMVITQNQVMSLNEASNFHEPSKFKPERWLHYRTCPRDQRPSPFASLPFGFGARSCIGQRLAELQIKIMVARLLQRYDIVAFPDGLPVKTTLIHNIDGPFSVVLRRR